MIRTTMWRRPVRFGALVACTSLVLAACGGGDDTADSPSGDTDPADSTSESSEPSDSSSDGGDADVSGSDGDADPDGILRIATALEPGAGVQQLDPANSVNIREEEWLRWIYGTLLKRTESGTYEPQMAESYEVVDPKTVAVVLPEGATFSDGEPYDAEAVSAGILRNLNDAPEEAKVTFNGAFSRLEDIVVDSPTELTFVLSEEYAGEFLNSLAGRESMVPSPAADPATLSSSPIGAGPFVVDEYRQNEFLRLLKNDTHVHADDWQLGGVELYHSAAGAPRSAALLSGEVDFAWDVALEDSTTFGDDDWSIEPVFGDTGYAFLQPCVTKPPFDDPDVRRAFQIMWDREQLSDLAFGDVDSVAPAYGLWPESHVLYNPEVEQYTSDDPEQAAELLANADIDGPIDIVWPITQPYDRMFQVMQSQAAELGVELNGTGSRDSVGEFVEPQLPGAWLIPASRSGADKYFRPFTPGSQGNVCQTEHSELLDLVQQLPALDPTSDEAIDLYHEIELTIAEEAYLFPLVHYPRIAVFDTGRVGGDVSSEGRLYSLDDLYIRS